MNEKRKINKKINTQRKYLEKSKNAKLKFKVKTYNWCNERKRKDEKLLEKTKKATCNAKNNN